MTLGYNYFCSFTAYSSRCLGADRCWTPAFRFAPLKMTEEDAIIVRDARKRYGKSANPILDGLNLTVAKGSM